jgi:hypothetical protein
MPQVLTVSVPAVERGIPVTHRLSLINPEERSVLLDGVKTPLPDTSLPPRLGQGEWGVQFSAGPVGLQLDSIATARD